MNHAAHNEQDRLHARQCKPAPAGLQGMVQHRLRSAPTGDAVSMLDRSPRVSQLRGQMLQREGAAMDPAWCFLW